MNYEDISKCTVFQSLLWFLFNLILCIFIGRWKINIFFWRNNIKYFSRLMPILSIVYLSNDLRQSERKTIKNTTIKHGKLSLWFYFLVYIFNFVILYMNTIRTMFNVSFYILPYSFYMDFRSNLSMQPWWSSKSRPFFIIYKLAHYKLIRARRNSNRTCFAQTNLDCVAVKYQCNNNLYYDYKQLLSWNRSLYYHFIKIIVIKTSLKN